jgi:SAM-dependent methyltransferase
VASDTPGRERRASDAKRIVADAYDHIATPFRERAAGVVSERRQPYLDLLIERLDSASLVLDLGCGGGAPYTAWLSERCRVLGVDISRGQLALARRKLPHVSFALADMSSVAFRPASFDAIAALYSMIHVPREEQLPLLERLRTYLRPGGRIFAVMGGSDWEGTEEDWLGMGSTMFWSHYDAQTNLSLIERAGFRVLRHDMQVDYIDDAGGSHLFVLAERP